MVSLGMAGIVVQWDSPRIKIFMERIWHYCFQFEIAREPIVVSDETWTAT